MSGKMNIWVLAGLLAGALTLSGCSTIDMRPNDITIGLTQDEVREKMGHRFTKRASKRFGDGQINEVWEYPPRWLGFNPKTFWVMFEDGKVVQWGEPGDFSGTTAQNAPVREYQEERSKR